MVWWLMTRYHSLWPGLRLDSFAMHYFWKFVFVWSVWCAPTKWQEETNIETYNNNSAFQVYSTTDHTHPTPLTNSWHNSEPKSHVQYFVSPSPDVSRSTKTSKSSKLRISFARTSFTFSYSPFTRTGSEFRRKVRLCRLWLGQWWVLEQP